MLCRHTHFPWTCQANITDRVFFGRGKWTFQGPRSRRGAKINLQVLSDYILCLRFLFSPRSVQRCLLFSEKQGVNTKDAKNSVLSRCSIFQGVYTVSLKLHTKVQNCILFGNVCSHLDSSSFAPSSFSHGYIIISQ